MFSDGSNTKKKSNIKVENHAILLLALSIQRPKSISTSLIGATVGKKMAEVASSSSGGAGTVIGVAAPDCKLECAWSLWYDKKQPKQRTSTSEFRKQLHKIATFDSIENFWKVYLFLKRPSQLDTNVNLYLFRDSCPAPMWESYPRGGCWILKVKKKMSGVSVLGKLWQDMVLALVGEQFEEPDVVGISICIRSQEDLISVWNADSRNEQIKLKIGEKLKIILDLELSTVIEYKAHADSMKDLSSFRGAKPFVYAAVVQTGLNPSGNS